MDDMRKIKFTLLALMALAIFGVPACDQLKNVYCTQIVPALSKACLQLPPATAPLVEVK